MMSPRTEHLTFIACHNKNDVDDTRQFFDKFGARLPCELRDEHAKLSRRLEHALSA